MSDLFNLIKLGSNPDDENYHQIHESLKLAYHIINSSTDAIIICEAEPIHEPGPRIVYVNETFVKDTGYSVEEVIGKTPRILQGVNTDPATRRRISDSLSQWKPVREDILNYKKNGEEFWVSLNIFPIADETGWFTHWISIQHNITERKNRENELLAAKAELLSANQALINQNDAITLTQLTLQESEQRLSLAVRSTGVGIWDLNIQTMGLIWDESMFDLYRMKREDFSNAYDAWEKSLHPDDKLFATKAAEDAIKNIKPFDIEFRIIWPNGEVRHIKAVAKVFFDDDGKPLRMLGTNIDVTEHAVIDKMKSEFVATAAHELRTPMTTIYGYSELLKIMPLDAEEQQEMIATIHGQSKVMIELLNDILDIAKMEAQAANLYEMTPQPIAPILEAITRVFITSDNHNKVLLKMRPSLPDVNIDKTKIEQAIRNLLSNAYKFSPNNGEINIDVSEVMHEGSSKLLIVINDHGIGMTPEQLKRVYEKFYRADQSGKIPGTGLGMAITKDIITHHGGSMTIESQLGVGTKVSVYLPVA